MDTKREHAEIRKRSEICFQAFTEISHSAQAQHEGGTYDHVTSGLNDTFSRFRLWISNIGVFADDQLSLDYRVREAGVIKELFLGQLEIIECRLLQFHEMFSKNTPEDDTFVTRNSSDLNESRRAVVPITTTTRKTNEPDPFKEWSSEELLTSIHRSIDWLQRLSNSIRRASSTSQNARAKYFKIEEYRGDKQASESEVRDRYKAMVHDISPGLQDEWMIERLVDTMILRLKRVLYRQSRQIEWSFPHAKPPSMQQTPSQILAHGNDHQQPVSSSQSGTSMPRLSSGMAQDISSGASRATTLNISTWKRNPMYMKSEISKAALTSDKSAHELAIPPPPKAATAGEDFTCPYCHLVLKSDVSKSLHAWKKHVKLDLEPYICIFSNCGEGLEIYPTEAEWLSHMKTTHRMGWYCVAAHEDHKPFVAETAEEYKHHMMTVHTGEFSSKELSLITGISRQAISPTIECCPFCSDAPKASSSLEKHVVKHLQEFAVLSLDIPEKISSQTAEPKKSPAHQSSIASKSLDFPTEDDAAESKADTRETIELFRQEWQDHLTFNDENESTSVDTMDTMDPDFMDYTNPLPPELLDDQIFELDWRVVQDPTKQRSNSLSPERSVQHPLPDNLSKIPRISIGDQSDHGVESTEESDTDATWDDFSIRSKTDEALILEDRIWQKAVKHANGATPSFWPPGVLKRIITRQAVTNEILRVFPNYSREEGESIAERVWKDKSGKTVKIFTILVLLDEVKLLVEHILQCRQGVRDHDLPLTLRNPQGSSRGQLFRRDSKAVCCFSKWRPAKLESFEMFQRRLNVPVFGLQRNKALIHLDLDDEDILPWCEEAVVPPIHAMSGGYGTVIRVRIHPRCHKFHDTLRAINVAGGVFAVKKLKQRTVIDFKREVDALKRFSGTIHPHLVTLLATFTHGSDYHMIFPWAECDLDQYWEDNPDPHPGDIYLVRWLSQQCLGIMEAVNVIHNPRHLTLEKRFGRHGDIKAENILWFKSRPDNPDDRGILVISDLGLTAINSDKSLAMQPNTGLKMTPSYRPPECDIKDGRISRSYDIWTLGCLYLELVCWLLRGNKGKLDFDRARTTPFIFGTSTNIYFDIEERKQSAPGMFVFKVKDVVSKTISELHDDPYCSRWVHDLLDLVENDMLVVLSKSHKRQTSQVLLDKLRAMDDRVQSSAGYSTGPAPQSRTPYWRPQVGTFAELNEAAQQNVVDHGVRTHESDERPLEQSENLARLSY